MYDCTESCASVRVVQECACRARVNVSCKGERVVQE